MLKEEKAAAAVRNLLRALGLNAEEPPLRDTPQRVAGLYARLFDGVGKDTSGIWGNTYAAGDGGLVAIRQIPFCSVCEHHLMPFFGTADIVYWPSDYGVAGFGKFTELVNILSHRPQIQERLADDIAAAVMAGLRAQGVMVRLCATQLCLITADKYTGQTVTTAALGKLQVGEVRYGEAVELLR